jgi:hypothetical protein
MIQIDARESIDLWMTPKRKGVNLGFGTYTDGEAINGSKDNTKAWGHIVSVSDARVIATSVGATITTSSAHGLSTGDWVTPTDHNGQTAINGNIYQVTVVSSTVFTLGGVAGSTAGTGGMIYPIVKDTQDAVLKELYFYLDADADANLDTATLNIRKGSIVNTEKTYAVAAFYDSTGSVSGGFRLYDLQEFQIRPRASIGTVPYP